MGSYLSLVRLPIGVAVDLLTGRCSITDVKRTHPERINGRGRSYELWMEEQPERTPYALFFAKQYVQPLDALTGEVHDRFAREFRYDESDDPCFWMVYGARLVGWYAGSDRPLPYGYVFPLRYSLPEDVEAINDQLASITEKSLRERIERILTLESDRYASEYIQNWMRETVAVKLLPALRQFYSTAKREKEIVVYWLG
jgi:hypothetical protein